MFARMIFYKKFLIFPVVFFLLLSTPVDSQNYPKKIRGYKVYQTKVSVKTKSEKSSENEETEAIIKVGEPEITDISLTGITFEVPAEIKGADQIGKVDFVAFEDFKVNDLDVEIEEYKESFELNKGEIIILPKPVKIFIGAGQTLRGAFKEIKDSKDVWAVTGRLFVFGKFKKYGFNFKRVVPIDVNIKIENPVKKRLAQNDKSK